MDGKQFDLLARVVARKGSRRSVLGVLLGIALLEPEPQLLAKSRKTKSTGGEVGAEKSKRRGPKECNIKKCPEGQPCPVCPSNLNNGAPGTCCTGGFCSCGGECCPDCGIVSVLDPDTELPRDVEELCCFPCGEDACCERCSSVGACLYTGPYGGGTIRRR